MNAPNMIKMYSLDCGITTLHLSERTHVMGILNITPDSFSDGGEYFEQDRAVDRAIKIEKEGADIIDIGGESTRPGSDSVSIEDEIKRVVPVIEKMQGKVKIPISIDTTKSEVAAAALQAGAHIVNDISGMQFDNNMASVVKRYDVPVILMHIKGTPKNMQVDPNYEDLMGEIKLYLKKCKEMAVSKDIDPQKIILDPGIGFGKKWTDNYIIIRKLKELRDLNSPLLVGVSRKSFIGKALNNSEKHRLMGTAAAVTAAILEGAHIVRVHDVKDMLQVSRIADRLVRTSK